MKTFTVMILAFVPMLVLAQKSDYPISSYLEQGPKAPNMHYIGEAWLTNLLQVEGEGDMNFHMSKATFRANSTLDWHKHATTQVLIIIEGEAYYQERGREAVILKKGDVIKCSKDTDHWHSSTKESNVTYLAIYGGAQPTTWTEKLNQEYYDGIAKKLSENKGQKQ